MKHRQHLTPEDIFKQSAAKMAEEGMPEGLSDQVSPRQQMQLAVLANSTEKITVEGMPLSHLHCALNCVLKVKSLQSLDSPALDILDETASGLIGLAEGMMDGAAAAYIALFAWYCATANEGGDE